MLLWSTLGCTHLDHTLRAGLSNAQAEVGSSNTREQSRQGEVHPDAEADEDD